MVIENAQTTPEVSVVIPSYQSAGHVRTCLRALEEQATRVSYEVVLVDSSSDGTDGIVSAEFPWVRMTHFQERKTTGEGRNVGIRMARGRFILFTDTDCVPCPGWLESMHAAFERYGAVGVGGAMANGTPWSPSGSAGFYLEFFRFMGRGGEPYPVRFLAGGNSGFRREVFKDASYRNDCLGEDMLFSWRTSLKGTLMFVPRGEIRHLNKTGAMLFLRYQRKIGRACVMYRSATSPRLIRMLRLAPLASLLLPFLIVPWITGTTLLRARPRDFLFLLLLWPLCLAGSFAWAWGFREALRQKLEPV